MAGCAGHSRCVLPGPPHRFQREPSLNLLFAGDVLEFEAKRGLGITRGGKSNENGRAEEEPAESPIKPRKARTSAARNKVPSMTYVGSDESSEVDSEDGECQGQQRSGSGSQSASGSGSNSEVDGKKPGNGKQARRNMASLVERQVNEEANVVLDRFLLQRTPIRSRTGAIAGRNGDRFPGLAVGAARHEHRCDDIVGLSGIYFTAIMMQDGYNATIRIQLFFTKTINLFSFPVNWLTTEPDQAPI